MTHRPLRHSFFCSLLLLTCWLPATAQPDTTLIHTARIPSRAMDTSLLASIVLPRAYHADTLRRFPVVYLLHGWSGDHTDWVRKVSDLPALADAHGLIIVAPDGGYDSWYFDSPELPRRQFATYIGSEVPAWLDAHFRSIPQRTARAITGLSMGGYGALSLAFAYPEHFGAAGSMSGGVDLRPFTDRWAIRRHLGEPGQYPDRWESYSVINQIHRLKDAPGLALIIDCGTGDLFYEVNQNLHQALRQQDIPHEFISRPGAHDWAYWHKAIRYQLLYFGEYFRGHR